jgi:DNA-binding IclR family transcriptional regulator
MGTLDTPDMTNPKVESRALAKGLQLLDLLAEAGDSLSLADLARRIGLGKASTFRLLQTLIASGHVTQDAHQDYALGCSWSRADAGAAARNVLTAARPEMELLSADLSETVTLAMLRDDHIRVADTIESPHHIRLSNPVGRILAPYASSLGKAVAAWQPPEILQRLIQVYGIYQMTPHTITDPAAIRHDMASIRERGYSHEREESVAGGCCFGAPLFDAGGQVRASVSVAMPLIRFTPELEIRIPEALRAAAARISRTLGAAL